MPAYDPVAKVISDAVVELGIVVASQPANSQDIADPFASTDQNVLQLLRLLKSGGRDLISRRDWTHLRKEYSFATVNGTESYPMPADYRKFIPNTWWDRSTTFRVIGPVGSEWWQFRKALPIAGTIQFYARIWQGQMFFTPKPGGADTIAFEYQPTSWCGPIGATLPNGNTQDAPATKDDVIFFDPALMVRRLKLDWKKAKGFDYSAEQADYEDTLYAAEVEDAAAQTIYLGGRSGQTPRRLDRWNVPDTGVGN